MTVGLARCLPRYDNDHRTPERRSKRGGPQPPYPRHSQPYPGHEPEMRPRPDFGETSYRGAQRLLDKKVIITGGDSGRTCITQEQHCYGLVERAIVEFGQVDVLVNNAAYQMSRDGVEAITTDEWDHTLKTNLYAMFWLCKAAFPKMRQGGAIINTSSIQAYQPSPNLLAYATTKGAIVTLPRRWSQEAIQRGIRVNSVAPGPIWTPLIPSTMPLGTVETFGENTPVGRAGQPAELAPI
jgi:hypothetical protein